ncbi:MAG: c-type cytochrome [Gemmatimonadetes bacterium]|nr:c-type cytochrome [Gemmatimonadota bacterium]
MTARSATMTRWGVSAMIALAAACGGSGSEQAATTTVAVRDTVLPAPAESLLTQDSASQSIRRGMALMLATRDSLPSHVGNELHCTSCHLNKGRKPFGNPLVGVANRYPAMWERTGTTVTLEDRVNDCFRRGLNGKPLAAGSTEMRDILAYLTWLSTELPKGPHAGLGVDSIPLIPADTVRGKTQFAMYCSRCHGPEGQGGKNLGVQHPGPPLWGNGSFTIGSGMARQRIVAAFVHHHMPFDAPGFVADSIANDVAGFVLSRPRPDFPGKELDWPNGNAPDDLRYKTKAQAAAPAAKQ